MAATLCYRSRRYALTACLAALAAAFAGTAPAADLTFELRVQDGQLPQNMRLIRVQQGDLVTLRWSADRSMLLHLHGYDLQWHVEPGAASAVSFAARLTGRFPIHAHDSASGTNETAHEDRALAYLEVYPR